MKLFFVWIDHNKRSIIEYPQVSGHINRLKKVYNNHVDVNIYFYDDIYKLLLDYDEELAFYFSKLNIEYPALISDISRIILLYKYGGIYQDVRMSFRSSSKIGELKTYLNKDITSVFEINGDRIRIGNICSRGGSKILKDYLDIIKTKLKTYYDNKETKNKVWEFGSLTLIDLFSKSIETDEKINGYTVYNYCGEKIMKINWGVRISQLNKIYYKGGHWSKRKSPLFVYNV